MTDSFRAGKEEMKLGIKPAAEALGLTLQDLGRQVRQAFYGEEAQRIQRGRDDIRVMVRYPRDERRSLGDVENMRIRTRTPGGGEVPFRVSMMSMFGLVAVTGAVVNDSLIMVDFINRARAVHTDVGRMACQAGGGPADRQAFESAGLALAAREAGVHRFRPILLPSLTTFFGLAPLMWSQTSDRMGSGIRSASTSVCAWFREGQRRYETHQGERLVLRQESWRSSPVQAPDQVGQGDGEGTARRRNQRCAARKHLASSGPTEVGGLVP